MRARLASGPIARAIARVDVGIYRLVRRRSTHGHVSSVITAYSAAGSHGAIWLAIGAAGAALDRPRRTRWARGAAAVALAYLFNTALKNILRRRRPAFEGLPHLIKTPTQLSFPSAHATASFAGARAYRGLLPGRALYPAAAAMGVSRVYLGVHYPSDILVGSALGYVLGAAALPSVIQR
jgi:undecaprenyl-diphosphatase